jgi:hypothetical protein
VKYVPPYVLAAGYHIDRTLSVYTMSWIRGTVGCIDSNVGLGSTPLYMFYTAEVVR